MFHFWWIASLSCGFQERLAEVLDDQSRHFAFAGYHGSHSAYKPESTLVHTASKGQRQSGAFGCSCAGYIPGQHATRSDSHGFRFLQWIHSLQMKIALVLLALAVLAAGILGLVLGLKNRGALSQTIQAHTWCDIHATSLNDCYMQIMGLTQTLLL